MHIMSRPLPGISTWKILATRKSKNSTPMHKIICAVDEKKLYFFGFKVKNFICFNVVFNFLRPSLNFMAKIFEKKSQNADDFLT